METKFSGKVIVLGDNVDTDQIYPGAYLALTDPAEIGRHCLEGVDPGLSAGFPKGGIIVAGRNFGCGSSREHAPIALLAMGARAVLADSFARIFYRNAINLGLVPVVCPGIGRAVRDHITVTLDLDAGTVSVAETGEVLRCDQLGEQQKMILEAGGIKPLMKARLKKEGGLYGSFK